MQVLLLRRGRRSQGNCVFRLSNLKNLGTLFFLKKKKTFHVGGETSSIHLKDVHFSMLLLLKRLHKVCTIPVKGTKGRANVGLILCVKMKTMQLQHSNQLVVKLGDTIMQ